MYVGSYSSMFAILACLDNCEECDDEVECLTCYDGYRGVLDVNGIATTCISKFPKPSNTWLSSVPTFTVLFVLHWWMLFLGCPAGCEDCALADDSITVTCSGCFDGYIHTSTGVCEGRLKLAHSTCIMC